MMRRGAALGVFLGFSAHAGFERRLSENDPSPTIAGDVPLAIPTQDLMPLTVPTMTDPTLTGNDAGAIQSETQAAHRRRYKLGDAAEVHKRLGWKQGAKAAPGEGPWQHRRRRRYDMERAMNRRGEQRLVDPALLEAAALESEQPGTGGIGGQRQVGGKRSRRGSKAAGAGYAEGDPNAQPWWPGVPGMPGMPGMPAMPGAFPGYPAPDGSMPVVPTVEEMVQAQAMQQYWWNAMMAQQALTPEQQAQQAAAMQAAMQSGDPQALASAQATLVDPNATVAMTEQAPAPVDPMQLLMTLPTVQPLSNLQVADDELRDSALTDVPVVPPMPTVPPLPPVEFVQASPDANSAYMPVLMLSVAAGGSIALDLLLRARRRIFPWARRRFSTCSSAAAALLPA